jgi:hypothetical protein
MKHIGRLLAITCLLPLLAAADDQAKDQGVSLATAPPVVVKAVPESGSDGVDSAITEIQVTYSKEMADGSWSWSTWGQNTFPQVTGKPHYLADKKTCVMPVHLEAGKMYAIWLNSDKFHGFQDAGGIAAVPYLLVFQTKP